MDNRAVATDFYKQALQCDVYSYQAFEALVQNQMLSAAEGSNCDQIKYIFRNKLCTYM